MHMLKDRPVLQEYRQFRKERRTFLTEAKRRFAEEKTGHGSFQDYRKAFIRHRVSYTEYMHGYEFWRLSEAERSEFVSQREMWCVYRKMISPEIRALFKDKVRFLTRYSEFVHRRWLWAPDASFSDFCDLVLHHDCIAKPLAGCQGKGVVKFSKGEIADIAALYEKCKTEKVLVEECIRACDELAEFHPSSLNTIRVVTISDGHGKCKVLGALLRMGAGGSIIDNTHAGGVFSPIDVETGVLMTDGINSSGEHFECHPDSGKKIKGFTIPFWEDILDVCKRATSVSPDTIFAGWDICVLPDGTVEMIEGNSGPDVDGGLQTPLKVGIKNKMFGYAREMTGVDPSRLISIWSRSYKHSGYPLIKQRYDESR